MTLGNRSRPCLGQWPSARALLIALAIATGLIDGAPIPTERVIRRLPPALQTASLRLYDVQSFLLAPFRPIKETFGINQRWALFSSTGPLRHRMWVEARREGEPFSLLYRAQDDEHTFLGDTLEYRRVRNVWNPNRRGAKPLYPAFALWMAREIFLMAMVVLSDLLIGKLRGAVPALWVPPPIGMGETQHPSSLLAAPSVPLFLWVTGVVGAFLLMVGALHRVAGAALTFALVMLPRFQPTGDGVDVLVRTVIPILALSAPARAGRWTRGSGAAAESHQPTRCLPGLVTF